MRFVVVSHHDADPEGTAAGRILWATVDGLRREGHEVRVVSWGPAVPGGRLRSLRAPRTEAAQLRIEIDDDEVPIADDWLSFPAVARRADAVLTLHSLARVDRVRSLRDVQDVRAQHRAIARAGHVLAYSSRVADAARAPRRTSVVPAAVPIPAEPLTPVDEPVVALVADWAWPPNRVALRRLLRDWPDVQARVPHARLLLAGRGDPGVPTLGAVARSVDVLSQAAVVAFPCPPTSGPKVKVLEALALGLPVVTTPAGAEGIVDPSGVVVGGPGELAALLRDPERRVTLGRVGRAAVARDHGPVPAARARVAALGGPAG